MEQPRSGVASAISRKKKLRAFVRILTVAGALSVVLAWSNLLTEMESRTWDWRLRVLARSTEADPQIKIITIDQISLEYMAEQHDHVWPWPRQLYAPILEYLKTAGARGVAFDILFTEPSSKGVYDDQDFASAMSSELPVALAAASRSGNQKVNNEALTIFLERQTEVEQTQHLIDRYGLRPPARDGVLTLPIPSLLRSSATIGNVNVPNDSDGVFRHIEPGMVVNGRPLLNLPFALFSSVNPNRDPDLSAISEGQLALRFAGPSRSYRTYSFFSILESFSRMQENQLPLIAPAEFAGSYVFIGMDAPGLLDLRPTPLAPTFPGVEFNATALDNLLHGTFIRKAPLPLSIAFALIMMAIAAAGVLWTSKTANQALLAVFSLGAVAAVCYASAFLGWWLPMVVPLLSTTVALLLALGAQFQLEGAQVRFIKQAFKHYVSPEVIEGIIADPTQLSLGGQKRELSIFFCDIAGFTSISEKMDAARLGQFLNTFLTEMTRVLLRNGGTVDKYVGDAIVAFWNAPLPTADHALRAVTAAIECQNRLEELRGAFERDYGVEVGLRIGIHTGFVSVGNFGSSERFNYTIIGDAANLASRLEGANKAFGTEIMISDTTYAALNGKIPCARVATIAVVGRIEPIAVYTPHARLQSLGDEASAAVTNFEEGRLSTARAQFEQLQGLAKLRSVYLERISEMSGADDGTPPDWDPVWRLSDK